MVRFVHWKFLTRHFLCKYLSIFICTQPVHTTRITTSKCFHNYWMWNLNIYVNYGNCHVFIPLNHHKLTGYQLKEPLWEHFVQNFCCEALNTLLRICVCMMLENTPWIELSKELESADHFELQLIWEEAVQWQHLPTAKGSGWGSLEVTNVPIETKQIK